MSKPLTRQQIVDQARTWINTPVHHQGRLKGVGVDCVGLLAGIFAELGVDVRDQIAYSIVPTGNDLLEKLAEHLDEIQTADMLPGDIAVFRNVKNEPQHVALITDTGMIHAYNTVEKVVEHGFGVRWQRLLVNAFRYPGVTD